MKEGERLGLERCGIMLIENRPTEHFSFLKRGKFADTEVSRIGKIGEYGAWLRSLLKSIHVPDWQFELEFNKYHVSLLKTAAIALRILTLPEDVQLEFYIAASLAHDLDLMDNISRNINS
jgi:hypothetical protein